jgi:3'-phosphoadenosine 5'-phosphosulfate sulfotransferase
MEHNASRFVGALQPLPANAMPICSTDGNSNVHNRSRRPGATFRSSRARYMSDWSAVAGTLGGVVVTLLATNARDRWRFRREKLWKAYEDKRLRVEQLFTALEDHREAYRATCRSFVDAIQSGERPNPVDLPRAYDAKVAMVIGLYATPLEPALLEINEREKAFRESVMQVIEGFDADGALTPKRERAWRMMASSLLTSRFDELSGAITRMAASLRAESADLTNRYAAPLRSRE